eukprot:7810166-Pyramimonas_sp.AAC.1
MILWTPCCSAAACGGQAASCAPCQCHGGALWLIERGYYCKTVELLGRPRQGGGAPKFEQIMARTAQNLLQTG